MGPTSVTLCLVLATTAMGLAINNTSADSEEVPSAHNSSQYLPSSHNRTREHLLEQWDSNRFKIISEPDDPISSDQNLTDIIYDESSGEVPGNVTSIRDLEGSADSSEEDQSSDVIPPTPAFMLELYEKFEKDRQAHPMANIVRSFVTQSTGMSRTRRATGPVSVHHLAFNLTSVQPHEDLYRAELRLYCRLTGHTNKPPTFLLYIYEKGPVSGVYNTDRLIAYRKVTLPQDDWVVFSLTQCVKRWMSTMDYNKRFEIHVENYVSSSNTSVSLSVVTSLTDSNQPLLVVFSDDRHPNKLHSLELHQLIQKELQAASDSHHHAENLIHKNRISKRDTSTVQADSPRITSRRRRRRLHARSLADQFRNVYNLSSNASDELHSLLSGMSAYPEFSANLSETQLLQQLWASGQPRRMKRAKRRRNPCHRQSMHVNFRDINWHSWIIAPQVYEAYECTGRCYFPIHDNLTPTKHAIIQTLLHTQRPKSAGRACCIPTALDPISMLYFDEQRVLTFKYRYDGMVVRSCGCR